MRLRVVLFGTGSPLSLAALAAAAHGADVLGVATPDGPTVRDARTAVRRLGCFRAARPLRHLARQLGVRILHGPRLTEDIARLAPDLLCVASFPRLLPPALLATTRHGALGLHPSLLPVHRGPDPLFWTYFDDDRDAGVTLHWLDAGEDSGDIVYQEGLPLSRGRPVTDLYEELARRGAGLLERALVDLPRGRAPREPQDASRATRQGSPDLTSCRIDWAAWGAERVFHVLSGLGRWYPLVVEPSGRRLRIGQVRLLASVPHDRTAGTLERVAGGLRIYCRQGIVELPEAAAAWDPLRSLRAAWVWRRRASG